MNIIFLHFLYISLFQVALRIRPMNPDEILQGAVPITHKVDDNVSIGIFKIYLFKRIPHYKA